MAAAARPSPLPNPFQLPSSSPSLLSFGAPELPSGPPDFVFFHSHDSASMRLVIRPSEKDAADWAALYIKHRITTFQPTAEKPFVLGLCTGTTMLTMYQA